MENVLERTQFLSLPEFAAFKKYWQESLTNKTEETRLPYSYYLTLDYQEGRHGFSMEPTLYEQLTKAAKDNPEAMFIILVASYRVLLYNYLGQTDLEIGIPSQVPKTLKPDFFTPQLLPVYNTINPSTTFRQVLKAEKEGILAAYQHQHFPLSEIEGYKTPKTALFFKNIHAFSKVTELDLHFERRSGTLQVECVYNGKLFSPAFIENFTVKYEHAIRCLLAGVDLPVEQVSLLEAHEADVLLKVVNATKAPYPSGTNLLHLLGRWAQKTPDALAVVSGNDSLTFGELDAYSDQIAHYLRSTASITPKEPVGILLPKSHHTIACMMGILKAGGAYLPISPRYPAGRIRMMLDDARVRTVLSSRDHIKLLNKLQWECADFKAFLCIDSLDARAEKEEATFKNELNSQKLWEHVGQTATDDIAGGGWSSSYTGENLPRAEMDEYRDNIVQKLTPLLTASSRVLEIGCASGISMFELAPKAALYYGTDISRVIIENNAHIVQSKGLANIQLKALAAHEIDQVEEKDFDVVIINSVIQCFEGHNYLRDVLAKVVALMKDEGVIFIGDVMDEDTREAFIDSLNEFKKNNLGKGYKVKTDFSNEIFYARNFFEDLRAEVKGIGSVSFSDKLHTIENELTRYRYDAMLYVDKRAGDLLAARHKHQHSLKDLEVYRDKPFFSLSIAPDAPAHVIYTSGSTGKPKGVVITHRNVLRLVQNSNYVSFAPGDKWLQTGAMEFDASTLEIWNALTNGLCLHIIDTELLLHAQRLKAYIAEHGITHVFVTAAALVTLIEQDVTVFDGLKYLLTGGEAMSTRHVNKLLAVNTSTRIFNLYGPTENTVVSTAYRVHQPQAGTVPIGRPISNSTCYVLDGKGRLVIPGAEGILYVGGDGVGNGYLNSPERTRERFVENPFIPGETLYNTGDLVRWNEHYELEFLGRSDSQVKIRGFRIELSEIENVLLTITGIREVRVVEKKNEHGDKSLAGYFTAFTQMDPAEILQVLSAKLPEYMVPAALMQLEALPLNANGKLDVARLPDPVSAGKGAFEAPANGIEEQLVEIWQQVLGISPISVHDNFFELGGHSLKAMKVLHKLSRDYQIKLTTLFTYPTIRELAPHLVYKEGNLLETLRRLKKEPLGEEVLRAAGLRKAWYREQMQRETFNLPGQEHPIESVLLTGSTGFMGIHLLYELLVNTGAQVYLLIRAESDAAARERIIRKIGFFYGEGFYHTYQERIHALAGEMEKPLLGLSLPVYQMLAEGVDTIINPAANVKHYGPEEAYKGNTLGVEELVTLAKKSRPKRIHHVSTAGVSFGQNYVFSEYDRVEKIPAINNTVYLQSKLDAENIIFRAMEQGVEASIYRVGNQVFNSKTGKFQENIENSAFYMLLRSFVNLGIMPDMEHKFYDFSFINTTAETIVAFARQKRLINDVFHVYNPHAYSLRDLYQEVIKPHFPHVQLVSLEEFPSLILEKYEDAALKEFIEHIIVNVRILEIHESNVMLVSDRSLSVMDKLGLHWQPLDSMLARVMVDFGKNLGFW